MRGRAEVTDESTVCSSFYMHVTGATFENDQLGDNNTCIR